jgi:hypothetical protein
MLQPAHLSHKQLIPVQVCNMHDKSYNNISSGAINSNRKDRYFDINAQQYTSFYRDEDKYPLPIFPAQALFYSNKYKTINLFQPTILACHLKASWTTLKHTPVAILTYSTFSLTMLTFSSETTKPHSNMATQHNSHPPDSNTDSEMTRLTDPSICKALKQVLPLLPLYLTMRFPHKQESIRQSLNVCFEQHTM